MYGAVHRNRHAGVLALFLTKAGFEVYLVMEGSFLNKLLKGLNDVKRTFDMAGTADAYAQFNHELSPLFVP
jgi:hypothetical protein